MAETTGESVERILIDQRFLTMREILHQLANCYDAECVPEIACALGDEDGNEFPWFFGITSISSHPDGGVTFEVEPR